MKKENKKVLIDLVELKKRFDEVVKVNDTFERYLNYLVEEEAKPKKKGWVYFRTSRGWLCLKERKKVKKRKSVSFFAKKKNGKRKKITFYGNS